MVFASQCVLPTQCLIFPNKAIERILNGKDFMKTQRKSDTLFAFRMIWGKGLILYSHPYCRYWWGTEPTLSKATGITFPSRFLSRTSITPLMIWTSLNPTPKPRFTLPMGSHCVFDSFRRQPWTVSSSFFTFQSCPLPLLSSFFSCVCPHLAANRVLLEFVYVFLVHTLFLFKIFFLSWIQVVIG